MNPINKSSLAQALGYGLAGVAAAALAKGSARTARPGFSPLDILSGRRRSYNPFKKTLTGALFSAPLLGNFIGGIGRRGFKRELLSSALLGLSAGLGSLAAPQHRGIFGRGGFLRRGGGILGGRAARGGSGMATIGRVLAGGLVAAAASKLINKTLRDRYSHEAHTYEGSRGRYDNEPHTHETRGQGRHTQDQPNF